MVTKSIAWNTGNGNITLVYQGQGDGTITISSDPNNLDTARNQVINVETTAGSPAVVKGFTVRQDACPVPVGTVLNYAYTGSYQEVLLPAGQYKLQCWGAQGGSNAAASSYGITAKAGGKGGYSEGIITLSSPTTVRVYVGGKGSSSAGGFNGGGSTSGSSSYSSGNEYGVSRMGGGGGATDIRLSDGALLSRMIVAGGGAGGAMCYKQKTSYFYTEKGMLTSNQGLSSDIPSSYGYMETETLLVTNWYISYTTYNSSGKTLRISLSNYVSADIEFIRVGIHTSSGYTWLSYQDFNSSTFEYTVPENSSAGRLHICIRNYKNSGSREYYSGKVTIEEKEASTSTSNESQVGGVGGGSKGGAYSSTYSGKQNAAGNGGSFGQGANQTTTNYRYCSGAGGGGWYGGGSSYSDSSMTNCKYSGGGSGFVNTAANAQYRPSGYTGLQLDSGETKAGNTSFPNTAGTGNETGHSGNGYAKITRLS